MTNFVDRISPQSLHPAHRLAPKILLLVMPWPYLIVILAKRQPPSRRYEAGDRGCGGHLEEDAAGNAYLSRRRRRARHRNLSIQDPLPVVWRSVFAFSHDSAQFSTPFEHKILRAMEFQQSLRGSG
jgi:hypothetical protein